MATLRTVNMFLFYRNVKDIMFIINRIGLLSTFVEEGISVSHVEAKGGTARRGESSVSWWMNLFFSHLDLACRLCTFLPEGKNLNKMCDGCVESLAILLERGTNELFSCQPDDSVFCSKAEYTLEKHEVRLARLCWRLLNHAVQCWPQ